MLKQRGVTIIELLVTIVVAGVILTLAVPSFVDTFNNNRVSTQASDIQASLAYARSEAIKRAALVTVCRSDDGTACSTTSDWNLGWMIFVDGGATGVKDGGDQVLRVHDGNVKVTITPSANLLDYIAYLPTGQSRGSGGLPNGTIQVCGTTDADRQIVISNTGRARVEATSC